MHRLPPGISELNFFVENNLFYRTCNVKPHRIILDIRYRIFRDRNYHPLCGPFQLCFSIMFGKSKQAEHSQNKMQYIPLH